MKTKLWICGMALAFLPCMLPAQEMPGLVPALDWSTSQQSGFPTSIAMDVQNSVWVGTEDKGVWRYDARTKAWTQFTTKDGLGDDNIYAVAVDKLNRVWVGHLNHGVSVWNGEKWKNYGILDGPLGDRVYAIATCPKDGDVWIATDCGLARYSIEKNEWDYFTRVSGLPSNQFQCIGFDSSGNIFAGTQCDGVAMADAADNYKKWRVAAGPLQMPNASGGTGFSTNLVSGITSYNLPAGMYHTKVEVVDVWTQLGECETSDGGGKWTFARGADWQANVGGLYQGPAVVETADDPAQELLREDWITCAQQDEEAKKTWIGYRQKGVEVRDINGKPLVRANVGDGLLVRALCIRPKAPPLIAIYDKENGGLKTLGDSTSVLEPGSEPAKTAASLPSPAKAPDAASLAALTKRLDVYQKALAPGEGVFMGDDWRTGGDWAGRYGTSYAILFGLAEARDAVPGQVYAGQTGYEVKIGLGPHTINDKTPQIHTGHSMTEDRHVLYSPTLGYRSEAEINDGSYDTHDYPYSWEGPDLWLDVKVPAGTHCVSLYFRNDDAQTGRGNKFRDYDVQLLPWSENRDDVQKADPLARARVYDFWGGVYKQFAVAGPARYVFRIGRNRSFGTKLQGAFIDQQTGLLEGGRKPLPGFEALDYSRPKIGEAPANGDNPLLAAASALRDKLRDTLIKHSALGVHLPLYIWAYRAAVAANAPAPLLANWRWGWTIWTPEDRAEFDETVEHAHQAMLNAPATQPAGTGN